MFFYLALISCLFLYIPSNGEISAACKGQYNAFVSCRSNTVSSSSLHQTQRSRLRSEVNACFRKHKCAEPLYDSEILPQKVKSAIKSEAWSTENLINNCRGFHDKQVLLIDDCRKTRTGKEAKEISNIGEKYYYRADFIFDAVAIAKAKKACPLTELLINGCVVEAFKGLHKYQCSQIQSQCSRSFSQICQGEFFNYNDDVCSCLNEVRSKKPERAAKTRVLGTPEAVPAITENKLIAALLEKTGLATLFSAGLRRAKRQATIASDNKLDLQGILNLFKGLQLPDGALDTAELETDFGLTAQEVNTSLANCDSTRDPRRLTRKLGTTPRKLLQLACDCDINESNLATQKACLSSPNCVGTVNFDLYEEAERLYKNMNTNHMRFVCGCDYKSAIIASRLRL